ncbi:MAG: glutamate racemase [Myxococcales bacterium]|jgi:glutamate racemase|nr:glutamate racemase [Myxococcales bacterium]
MGRKAIGVFDSGVGGLTVLKAIHARLPHERTAYLGDTARVPYGSRSPEVVIRYCIDNARFLLRQDLKLLVVACNTASAVALGVLRKMLDIPVLGVIEPGARAAIAATKNGRVGIIGTHGTVKSGAYQSALRRRRGNIELRAMPCPLLVPLAEEGWIDGDIARLIAARYLANFDGFDMDTLVLGCTHYPLLREAIRGVLGEGVTLIDSAEVMAEEVEELLTHRGWRAPVLDPPPHHHYFVTDRPELFAEVGARFLGKPLPDVERICFPEAT